MKKFITTLVTIWMYSSAFADKIDPSALKQFEFYLNNIKSIAVEFKQIDQENDQVASGKLLVSKPYKFRVNYYPPFPLVIVGNKNYVSVYDYEMEQLSRIKASENIFSLLMLDNIDLNKYFRVEEAIDSDGQIKVTVHHMESDGRSTIIFAKNSGTIIKIQTIQDDNVTTLMFDDMKFVKNFDDDLFGIKNPDIFGIPRRLSKAEIEAKYILQGKN